MIKRSAGLLVWLMLPILSLGQSVGVNTPTPHSSAVLDVNSTEKGFLPPRMTTAQRDAIASPSPGLVIYNSETNCLEFWNASGWISTCATVAPCSKPPASTAAANSPVCAGQSLNLTATPVPGATYVWSGPNGFNTTAQNPTISPVSAAHAGTYTLRTWALGCYSDPTTVAISVVTTPTWRQVASFPAAATLRGSIAAFGLNGKVYAGGGGTYPGNYQSDFYEYDPVTNAWTAKAAIPGQVRYGYTSFSDGALGHVVGGWHEGATYQSLHYAYDPVANSWAARLAHPTTLSEANVNQAEGVGGGYVLGGTNASGACGGYYSTLRYYDQATNTWTNKASIPGGNRAFPITMMIGGYLYAGCGTVWAGGCNANYSDFYRYDPVANTWAAMAAYPGNPGAKQAFYAIGTMGYVMDGTSLYIYDSVANSWSLSPCPVPSTFNACVAVGGKGYFINTGSNRQVWEFTP